MRSTIFLINVLCLVLACISVKAQICETPAPPPPAWLFNPALRSTQSSSLPYTMRVFIHCETLNLFKMRLS